MVEEVIQASIVFMLQQQYLGGWTTLNMVAYVHLHARA